MALLIDTTEFFTSKPKALISPRTRHLQLQQQQQNQQQQQQQQALDIQQNNNETTDQCVVEEAQVSIVQPVNEQLSLEAQLELEQQTPALSMMIYNKKQCRRMYWLEKFNENYQKEHDAANMEQYNEDCDDDCDDEVVESQNNRWNDAQYIDKSRQEEHMEVEDEEMPLLNTKTDAVTEEPKITKDSSYAAKFQRIEQLNLRYNQFKQTLDNSPQHPLLSIPSTASKSSRSIPSIVVTDAQRNRVHQLNQLYTNFIARVRAEPTVPLKAYNV
jgi:hypothetical protein